tara:strand:- start:215 stop:691 length:477 start_codon:yes stop_codon:yes gene_type:complete
MKRILIVLIGVLSYSTISAQKYTDQYIKDANKTALNWLSDINHNNYEDAYILLAEECKIKYEKSGWILYITQLMKKFGSLESRLVIDKYFQSEIEEGEDGFYVFIKYDAEYLNKKNLTETIILKQNYKLNWEIYDYRCVFLSGYGEIEPGLEIDTLIE